MRANIHLIFSITFLLSWSIARAALSDFSGVYVEFGSVEKNYKMLGGYQSDTSVEVKLKSFGLTLENKYDFDVTPLISVVETGVEYRNSNDEMILTNDSSIGVGALISGHLTEHLSLQFGSILAGRNDLLLLFSSGIGYRRQFAGSPKGIELSLHLPTFGRISDGYDHCWGFFDFKKSVTVGIGFKW
jgi:hypothetical protein